MSLLEKLWDDTVAGPRPDSGLGKLRKHPTFNFRPNAGKESVVGSPRSYGNGAGGAAADDAVRVTRSIMIVRPPPVDVKDSPPASPAGSTPGSTTPGSTPPVSPFAAWCNVSVPLFILFDAVPQLIDYYSIFSFNLAASIPAFTVYLDDEEY
ncbi:dormancy-associated protein homolog 3-like isoform X1 [Coffea arabica]|uniref:Dormancy-associated protein homolog 3-like isoform X1 n=1 Tax=Coffea arabica TaxID=13443 RepID=A0ABM4WYZ9_COFAR